MNTTDDQKILDEARRRFKAAADADSENRENALDVELNETLSLILSSLAASSGRMR